MVRQSLLNHFYPTIHASCTVTHSCVLTLTPCSTCLCRACVQRKRQYTSTSTGFVAAGGERWLLTNAHSVDYHTQVRQQQQGRCTTRTVAASMGLALCVVVPMSNRTDPLHLAHWQARQPCMHTQSTTHADEAAAAGWCTISTVAASLGVGQRGSYH
jgi:hypothetical protein